MIIFELRIKRIKLSSQVSPINSLKSQSASDYDRHRNIDIVIGHLAHFFLKYRSEGSSTDNQVHE